MGSLRLSVQAVAIENLASSMKAKELSIGQTPSAASATMARFTGYTLAVFGLTLSLPLAIGHGDIILFKENGPIEWFQCMVLAASSAVFVYGGHRLPHLREVFALLALISAFAAIRELDGFLDRTVPWIGWKVGFLALLFAVGLAYQKSHLISRQLPEFLASRGFVILWAGFLIAVPVGQLIGHGAFLQMVMGDDYNRDYKRAIEETLETLGYILVLVGSFEAFFQLWADVSKRFGNGRSFADPAGP